LKTYPAQFDKLINLQFDGVDLSPICDNCNMDDVIAYLDTLRENFKPEDDDPTCDGSATLPTAGDPIFQLIKVFLKSTCVASDAGNCWADVLPKTLPGAGLEQTLGSVDFNNLGPETLTTIMQNLDIESTCEAMKNGGCCSGMMLDIMAAMTELSCLNTPLIKASFSSVGVMCGGIDDTCESFEMPSYTAPDECPEFQEWVKTLSDLKLPSDSSYAGCKVEEGCPKNDCELFICKPSTLEEA